MLVVTRHPGAEPTQASRVLAVLSERPGFVRGWVGSAADEPELITLVTEWANVGAWRRALSPVDVRIQALPFFGTSVDEPTAFLVLDALGSAELPVVDPSGAA